MANTAVKCSAVADACRLWLSRALQPKASNTVATGLLAYSYPKTYFVNALAAALPLHWTKRSLSSQGTILSSFPKMNSCYRRNSECSSMQCPKSQNQRRVLLTGLPLAWLIAKLLFIERPNTVSWHALSNQAPLVPASSAVSLTALRWRAWCFRELSSTSSYHRAWVA